VLGTITGMAGQCTATTRNGQPCHATPGPDGYCIAHRPRNPEEPRVFGGAQPGGGRPRKPRLRDELEKYLAENAERLNRAYWANLFRAMDTDDERVRLQATVELGNRLYGRPAQSVDVAMSGAPPVLAGRLVIEDAEFRQLAVAMRDRVLELEGGQPLNGHAVPVE
jgi:hypothetical protein